MLNFCTLFDRNYLSKGLALFESLNRHCESVCIYVLCLDDFTFNYLNKSTFKNILPISLYELEDFDKDLLIAKGNRTLIEYYFTISPCLPLFLLKTKPELKWICSLDADIYFYSNPKSIFDDFEPSYSILITPHKFTQELIATGIEKYGIYNVSFQAFKNNTTGLTCLEKWRLECLYWCKSYYDEGNNRYADQKYLDTWLSDFSNEVCVLNDTASGLAVWNINNYQLEYLQNQLFSDGEPIIFYHFHQFDIIYGNWIKNGFALYNVSSNKILDELIYLPYVHLIYQFNKKLSLSRNRTNINKEIVSKIINSKRLFYLFNCNKLIRVNTYFFLNCYLFIKKLFRINKFLNIAPIPFKEYIDFSGIENSPPPQCRPTHLPKITIITPSFNQGQYIEETILSVLGQNYPNLEYIIIDGGSTDETVSIIKKYEKWITYWVSEPDNGQSDAINKGLIYATGDIVNWLNSDDVYLPNTLLKVGEHFSDKNINVLCGQEYLWYPDGQKVLTNGTTICESIEETIAVGHIQQPPTFFRLAILKQLGGVHTNLHFCMDAELWVNYLVHFGFTGVKKVDIKTNLFRMHELAKTTRSRSVYFSDKYNILISLLQSVNNSEKLFSKAINNNLYFSKYYSLPPSIDKKLLAVHVIERIFNFGVQYINWCIVFRLYFFVLKTKPLGWNWRFYAAPFIKIKRLFRPL